MVNETLARRYATAIFSTAEERQAIDRVGEGLAAIDAAIGQSGAVHDFFVAPVVDRHEKERVLRSAFEGKVEEVALHAVLLLVRKRRESLLHAIVTEYQKRQLAARGVEPLRLTTARELAPHEMSALVERLERLYARKFDVTPVVDPSLIGGVRILMGDRRIDGTVSGRLEALARDLFATN